MGIPALDNSAISVVFLAVDSYTLRSSGYSRAEPDFGSRLFRVLEFFCFVRQFLDWRKLASKAL